MIDLRNSIVKVKSGDGQGSGVLLQGGYILTAYHNIKGGKADFYALNESGRGFDLDVNVRPKPVQYMEKTHGDFIIYELAPDDKTKFKSRLLPLVSESGKEGLTFDCYGFPKDSKFEENGLGSFAGKISATKQFLGNGDWGISLKADPGFIEPGFSGSPIYCPTSGGVLGIILIENKGVAVFGVGGAWIRKFLPSNDAPVSRNKFFDKKLPNLDLDCFTCNREEQIEQLNTYFQQRQSQREHQQIFLFGTKWDKPDSLVCRFLQEQRSKKRPLQFDIPFEKIQDAYDYLKPTWLPLSEDELKDIFESRLQEINQYPKSDYVVFFWRIPANIWKNQPGLNLLATLLNGTLLNNWAKAHRLLIFYWLEPEIHPISSNWLVRLVAAKSTCRASQAVQKILSKAPPIYCLLDSWDPITEIHLENWFDKCCVNIARASTVYRKWLKDEQLLKLATVEAKLQDLIIQHNPDYQHLRS